MNDNEVLTARAQVGLSFLIVLGYFGIKVAEGLGYLKDVGDMNEMLMLVLFFWFQRQRTQGVVSNETK
jgi:hypothetical protein